MLECLIAEPQVLEDNYIHWCLMIFMDYCVDAFLPQVDVLQVVVIRYCALVKHTNHCEPASTLRRTEGVLFVLCTQQLVKPK